MRERVIAGIVVIAVATDSRAADGPSGIELSARTGVGLPLGRVQGTHDNLSDTISVMVPIWADVGYRFTPNWYAGIYLLYGWGVPVGALNATCSCLAFDIRVGANVQYHLFPNEKWDPWFGGGLGFEWLGINGPNGGDGPWASGWEFANAQAGLEGKATDHIRVGPFVALTLGQYDGTASQPFDRKALHGWFVIGVTARFNPPRRKP